MKPSEVNRAVIAAAETGEPLKLLAVVGQYLPQMNLVNLSTSIHRLAKLAVRDSEVCLVMTQGEVFEELLAGLRAKLTSSQGAACPARSATCMAQTLSNVTWSLAHLYAGDVDLLGVIAGLSAQHVDGFKPFELSMLLWGFAKVRAVDTSDKMAEAMEELFRAAGMRIASSLGSFSFRSLAMIAWAYATARQRNPGLFSGLAKEMSRTATSANCQEIGNTVWAFATAGHRDGRLLAAMAQAAVPAIHGFKAQEISNMLWGFATLGFRSEEVFLAGMRAALSLELGAQHLSVILWSCAKVMPKHAAVEALLVRFAPLCVVRLGAFKPQEISSTVQALSRVLLPEDASTRPPAKLVGVAPLHEDVLMLLESLAHWISCHGHAMPSWSFSMAVSTLILLGARAERRLDLALEPAVLVKAGALRPAARIALLQALLHAGPPATGAVSVLSAGVAGSLHSLDGRDSQALARLYLTQRGDSPGSAGPSPGELGSWCLALAAGLPLSAAGAGAGEPEAAADAPGGSDEASTEIPYSDDVPLGSEHRVQTAESLPFLDWTPAPQ